VDDYLVRVIAREVGVRVFVCITTNLVKEGRRRHETAPAATVALGEALTGVALLGALLKVRQRIAVKLAGDGPLGKIVVESTSYGKIRGYVAQPEFDMPRSFYQTDITELVGLGDVKVVKDVLLPELVESVVPLRSGTLANNLEGYLNESEQIPSLVEIGVVLDDDGNVVMAGGLLVQSLPGMFAVDVVAQLAERVAELPPIAVLLNSEQTPEDVVAQLLSEIEYQVLEARPLVFQCTCSWERSAKALISLGRTEIESLLETGEAVVDCHFCHERYVFDRPALEDILESLT
jgi:molecular chaperone Hsp33